jgi:hypothetical protein
MSDEPSSPRLGPTTAPQKRARSPIARILPVVVVVALVAAVVVAVLVSGGGDESSNASTTTTPAEPERDTPLTLAGATSWPGAQRDGTADQIQWGKRCDTSIGKLALPLFPLQDCYAPFTGDNGGATSPGVTGDTIKVVVYLAQENDPVLKFVYAQIDNDDTVEQQWQTYQKYNEMFSHYYETYGRKVQLVRFDATGAISDPVAAVADAETIANDIRPFLVIGGPLLTNAFADTLASNKVVCVACGPTQPNDWYAQRSPYVWDVTKNAEQNQQMIAEYIGKRLAGRKAVHAGAGLADKPRVFGYIRIKASDTDQILEDKFTSRLRDDYGVSFARIETYESPIELSSTGRDMITRLKEKGVTSVVFSGDPLAPQTLTKIATTQDFHPEWIITGTVLVDTTAFARTYDQDQWSHAFGPSNLAARVDASAAGSLYLYRWYYGSAPPADQTAPVILPSLQFLYAPLQAMGTDVTPENFRKVQFGGLPVDSTPITYHLSYGNHGIWPAPDYSAIDDQTEVWWDPKATGPDELGRDGVGMYRYVAGGKRYLPGDWPKSDPDVFDTKGSVTVYDHAPKAAEISTTYTPVK